MIANRALLDLHASRTNMKQYIEGLRSSIAQAQKRERESGDKLVEANRDLDQIESAILKLGGKLEE